jgi:hypothetical protein
MKSTAVSLSKLTTVKDGKSKTDLSPVNQHDGSAKNTKNQENTSESGFSQSDMELQSVTTETIEDKALLNRFKLRGDKRLIMIVWGLVLAQLAAPIGSAIYFLFTQVAYKTTYGGTTMTWFYLKDTYDRLPVHVSNLLGANWFTSQAAPAWWVVARHDFRHVTSGQRWGRLSETYPHIPGSCTFGAYR